MYSLQTGKVLKEFRVITMRPASESNEIYIIIREMTSRTEPQQGIASGHD